MRHEGTGYKLHWFLQELRPSTTHGGPGAAEASLSVLDEPHPKCEGIPAAPWTQGGSRMSKR